MYSLNHIDYLFSETSVSESGRSHQSRPKNPDPHLNSTNTIPTEIDLNQNLYETSMRGDAPHYRKPPDKLKSKVDTWMYGADWNNTPMRERNHLTPNEVCLSPQPIARDSDTAFKKLKDQLEVLNTCDKRVQEFEEEEPEGIAKLNNIYIS